MCTFLYLYSISIRNSNKNSPSQPPYLDPHPFLCTLISKLALDSSEASLRLLYVVESTWESINIFRLLGWMQKGTYGKSSTSGLFQPLLGEEGKYLTPKFVHNPAPPPCSFRAGLTAESIQVYLPGALSFTETGCPAGETWDSPGLPVAMQKSSPGFE